jgi:hypothetical protein
VIPAADTVVLGGMKIPGLAIPRSAGTPRKWDERAGYAFTGAVLVFTGTGLAKLEIDVYAWEEEHFAEWEVFARAVLQPPTQTTRGKSLSIQHPAINAPPILVTQVVVEDVSQWEDSSGLGEWVCTIKLIQYRAPTPVLVKPFEGPQGSPVAIKAPADPELAQIAELTATVKGLAQ